MSRQLVRAMRKDVEFLRRQRLMDYSMLIAIEKSSISIYELHNEPTPLDSAFFPNG